MSYMDTKFCKECDADYDWACPECPSCVARKGYMQLHNQFLLAKAVIDALLKCDRPDCKALATRQQTFDELDSGVEFKTAVWRCEEHKFTNGVEIIELDYAPQLRKYLESVK